jgi:hypothetical protein
VRLADPDDIEHEAEGTLAGTFDIAIPPHAQGSATGNCTMSRDVSIFAVLPHMHELGTHMTVTAEPQAGSPTVMHDADYTFEDQRFWMVSPEVSLSAGDRVSIDCSYDNPTDNLVTFGDSTKQEMCFASLWTYPPLSAGLVCSD